MPDALPDTQLTVSKHTHPFNSPFSGTTQVSQCQKGKNSLDFTEARDSERQWHQLGHMQVCTSLHTDNHASTPPLSFLQAGCSSCCPTNSIEALKDIHTHPFNGPLSGTTQVSRYQKGLSGFYWSRRQWVAVASAGPYASLHLAPDSTPPLSFFIVDALPAAQPTASKHWRQSHQTNRVKTLKKVLDHCNTLMLLHIHTSVFSHIPWQ